MAPPILTFRELRLSLGESLLFDRIDLAIERRERICLVGRNGSGKSTMLRILAGLQEADSGELFVQPGIRVAYMPQNPRIEGFATVIDYVLAGLADDEQEHAYRGELLLKQLNIGGTLATERLSGGEARRAALARTLLIQPDILLLDEPTNHLDLPAIEWLEEELLDLRCALVTISHDRAFLERTTDRTWWLDRTELRRHNRGFADFESWSETVYAAEDKERHELNKLIAVETRWSHEGITARRKRNQGRLNRLYELRERRQTMINRTGAAEMKVEAGGTSGKMVMECDEITKSYDNRPIVHKFSTRILRGDRIGIIGANGSGKTTLIRMMMGDLTPDSGIIRRGTNLETLYLDQRREVLDETATLQDVLCPRGGDQVDVAGNLRHITGFLKDFLFSPGQARSPVNSLSGGERSRLLLARAMCRPCNFMILDEPTNDLDMETLDLLVELLAEFKGTLIAVSHDRDFLNRVVGSTLVFEGAGRVSEYPGGYDDYLMQRQSVPNARSSKSPKKELPSTEGPVSRARLSYKFQRQLDLLPEQIAGLEAKIWDIEARLDDSDLFNNSPEQYANLAARLTAAQAELSAAEERWLELEDMREQAEGA